MFLLTVSCSNDQQPNDVSSMPPPPVMDPLPVPPALPPLSLESATPSSAPTFGGTELILSGQHFSDQTLVQINGVAVHRIRTASSTQLTVVVPPSKGILGPVHITVTNPDGATVDRADLFSYRTATLQFGTKQPYPYTVGGGTPSQVVLGDINGDHKLDFVFGDGWNQFKTPFFLRVAGQLGDGSGDISKDRLGLAYYGTDGLVTGMALTDITNDNIPDLIIANDMDGKGITVLEGDRWIPESRQRFRTPGTVFPTPAGSVTGMATGDFNGDNKLDLALTHYSTNQVSLMLGDGTGSFAMSSSFGVGNSPMTIAVADLNQDKFLDVVVSNTEDATISVLLGNGDGTFQPERRSTVGKNPRGLVIGDFNQDGWPDIAVANTLGDTLSILLGKKNGLFHDQVQISAGPYPYSLAMADFNGDGMLDIAVAGFTPWNLYVTNDPTTRVHVWLGDGIGGFPQKVPITPYGFSSTSMAVGDLNDDGKPDLVATDFWNSSYHLLLNQSN